MRYYVRKVPVSHRRWRRQALETEHLLIKKKTMEAIQLIRDFLQERTQTDPALVTPDARLETLGIDSFTLLELIFEFEEKYGVSIPNDTQTPETVQDLLNLIARFRQQAEAKPS
ncbi:acyl carrier protein [Halothiobacillus neapolitanus]|nr:acyl carrier protein [Halothiobacillus neapolitanus]